MNLFRYENRKTITIDYRYGGNRKTLYTSVGAVFLDFTAFTTLVCQERELVPSTQFTISQFFQQVASFFFFLMQYILKLTS